MPLDWAEVARRYESDPEIEPIATSSRRLTVVAVDDERLEVRFGFWTKPVERAHLEEAVRLIEEGKIGREWSGFVQTFGKLVTTERRSLTAHLLKDLGYLQ